MKKFDIKFGSVILWKKYNVFKRLWAKIKGKELPYNRWAMFNAEEEDVYVYGSDLKLYELIKPYNGKELKKLDAAATNVVISDMILEDDLKLIINCIRPNTIPDSTDPENGDWLAGNKYYKEINEKTK